MKYGGGITRKHIALHRKLQSFTQAELAERVNCGENHISRIENGKAIPGSLMFNDLQRVLNLNLSEINSKFDETVEKNLNHK